MTMQSQNDQIAELVGDPVKLYRAMQRYHQELHVLYGRFSAILAAYEKTLPAHVKEGVAAEERRQVVTELDALKAAQRQGPTPVGLAPVPVPPPSPMPAPVAASLVDQDMVQRVSQIISKGMNVPAENIAEYLNTRDAGKLASSPVARNAADTLAQPRYMPQPVYTQNVEPVAAPAALPLPQEDFSQAAQTLQMLFGPQGLLQRIFPSDYFPEGKGYLRPITRVNENGVMGYSEKIEVHPAGGDPVSVYNHWATGFYHVNDIPQFFINHDKWLVLIDLDLTPSRQFPNVRDRFLVIDKVTQSREWAFLHEMQPVRLSAMSADVNRVLHNFELEYRKRAQP